MKNALSLTLILFALQHSLFAQSERSICPVDPRPNTQILPDGSKITLVAVGNEMVHYLETVDGYTVVQNKQGTYDYATLNEDGNLVASGILANESNHAAPLNGIKHLRYSAQQLAILQSAFEQANPVSLGKKAGGKPFPSAGKRKVLALLVQYPNLLATLPKSNFDSLFNKPNYTGTGSYRDYYLKASFGQLDLSVDVVGWYTADSGYMYYAYSSSSYNSAVGKLIRKAVASADSAVDFSQYDNDKDGYVDGIIVMHSGIGAEEQSAPNANNYIWSHRSNLQNSGAKPFVDGVYVDAYGCFPEKRWNSGAYSQVGIGVICHEFGHLLDLPDLYATNYSSEGDGNYSIMAGGPWLNNERTPCFFDAWSKMRLGWLTPTVISSSGPYTIAKSVADSNFVFKINTPVANEYFLLENRQKKGFDSYLPSKGLAIWHVNTNKAKLLSESGSNSVNSDTATFGLALMQADGRRDLENNVNRGDAGDLYPGSAVNRSFTPISNPSSILQFTVSGVKQPSYVNITGITQNSDSSITFNFGSKPVASFDPTPSSGCAPLMVSFTNNTVFANKFLWKFSDGRTSNLASPMMRIDSVGNLAVTLYVLDSLGKTLDSMQKTVQVLPSPTAIMSVNRKDSNTFAFTNLSTGALYVVWRFGSNQSSTANNPVIHLTSPGSLLVQLIAYSANNCSDTLVTSIDFWPLGFNVVEPISELKVFPNPAHQSFTVSFQLKSSDLVQLNLLNSLGQEVRQLHSGQGLSGNNEFSFDASSLVPGIYLLQVKTEHGIKSLRLSID